MYKFFAMCNFDDPWKRPTPTNLLSFAGIHSLNIDGVDLI